MTQPFIPERSIVQPSTEPPVKASGAPKAPDCVALCCLLIVAAALRLGVAWSQHNLIWADEVYQVVEPAHRLVYGHGLVAWEWIVGMRSWLFPGLIAAVLWLDRLVGFNPASEIIPVQIVMTAASLIPVATAFRWGERLGGLLGGALVGGFVAFWVDLIYLSPHPLSDVIASDVLMAGLYAALPLTTRPSRQRLVIAGALFGLTFALRMQLGPALLAAALFACGRDTRAWSAVVLGGGLVLAATGVLDWITLGSPFQSIWLNFWLNIVKGVSNGFGTTGPVYFIAAPIWLWGPVSGLVLFQGLVGGRRFPALLAIAAAVILTQSFIAHKEWRFIFPALAPIVTLCGIGALELTWDLERHFSRIKWRPGLLVFMALGLWIFASIVVAIGPGYRSKWTRQRDFIDAFALAARQQGLCGLAMENLSWPESPGSAALPSGVPIYVTQPGTARHDAPSYNVAVADRTTVPPQDLYRRLACFEGNLDSKGRPLTSVCVWRRSGGCTPGFASAPKPNWPAYFLKPDGTLRLERVRPYAPQSQSP